MEDDAVLQLVKETLRVCRQEGKAIPEVFEILEGLIAKPPKILHQYIHVFKDFNSGKMTYLELARYLTEIVSSTNQS